LLVWSTSAAYHFDHCPEVSITTDSTELSAGLEPSRARFSFTTDGPKDGLCFSTASSEMFSNMALRMVGSTSTRLQWRQCWQRALDTNSQLHISCNPLLFLFLNRISNIIRLTVAGKFLASYVADLSECLLRLALNPRDH
jgi:hypothetical protein